MDDEIRFNEAWTPLEKLLDDVVAGLAADCNDQAKRIRELEQGIRRHRYLVRVLAIQHMDDSGRIDDIGLRMLDEACRDLWLLTSEESSDGARRE